MQSLPAVVFFVADLSLCQKIGGYGDSKVPKFTEGNWSQFFVTTIYPLRTQQKCRCLRFCNYFAATHRSRVIELPNNFPYKGL